MITLTAVISFTRQRKYVIRVQHSFSNLFYFSHKVSSSDAIVVVVVLNLPIRDKMWRYSKETARALYTVRPRNAVWLPSIFQYAPNSCITRIIIIIIKCIYIAQNRVMQLMQSHCKQKCLQFISECFDWNVWGSKVSRKTVPCPRSLYGETAVAVIRPGLWNLIDWLSKA